MNRANRSRSPSKARSIAPASSAGSSDPAGRSAATAASSAGAWSNGGPTYWSSTSGCSRPTSSRRRCSSSRSGSRRLPSASSTARPTGTTATAAAPSSIRARTASIASSAVAAYWTVGSSSSSEIAAASTSSRPGVTAPAGTSRRFATSSRTARQTSVRVAASAAAASAGSGGATAGSSSSASDRVSGARTASSTDARAGAGRGGRETTRTRLTGTNDRARAISAARRAACRRVIGCLSMRGPRQAPRGQPADSTPGTESPWAADCATSRTSAPRWAATWATLSMNRRTAVSASACDTTSGGDIRTQSSPASRTSRPRSKRLHLDGLGGLAGVELDADHQALAAHVTDEPREPVEERREAVHDLAAADLRRWR